MTRFNCSILEFKGCCLKWLYERLFCFNCISMESKENMVAFIGESGSILLVPSWNLKAITLTSAL